jgi:hypothetical protein
MAESAPAGVVEYQTVLETNHVKEYRALKSMNKMQVCENSEHASARNVGTGPWLHIRNTLLDEEIL